MVLPQFITPTQLGVRGDFKEWLLYKWVTCRQTSRWERGTELAEQTQYYVFALANSAPKFSQRIVTSGRTVRKGELLSVRRRHRPS